MGCVYRRGNIWWIKYSRNGKPYYETTRLKVNEKTLRLAERKLKEREGAIVKGEFLGIRLERIRFDELAEDFLNDYRVNGRKSLDRAEHSMKHLRPFFSGRRVVEITTARVKEYVGQRMREGAANGTINRELSGLRRMLHLGAKHDPPKVLKVPYIPMLRESNVRKGYFEHEEFLALRDALPPYLRPVVTMAYYTGMRKGEIVSLRWPQVNLEERRIDLEPGTTKTGEPRTVYMGRELYETLRERRVLRDRDYPNCPWVFFNDGKPIRDFRAAWERASREAGLRGRVFHDFRRTAVRNMIRAGVPERVAMSVSGHRTRAVFDRYNIVDERDLEHAAFKVDRYLEDKTVTVSVTVDELARSLVESGSV